MPDDAQWIDEAAEQQIAPQDTPSPDAPVTPDDPGMMQRFQQFINKNLFPPRQPAANIEDVHPYFRPRQRELQQQLQHPLPRPRPDDADAKAYDENRGWDVLTERQKQMIRAQQIQQYNQIMKGRR